MSGASRGAGERGSGGAGEQGAGEQGSGGAGERGSRERGAWEQGEGEQGAGELCEAARPGLTLPAQGCVRLREAARRQGLAAWPGRRHSTYTGGGRVGCMQGAREPATTSSPCRRDMCPYLGCWGATAGLGSSSPLLLRLQGLQAAWGLKSLREAARRQGLAAWPGRRQLQGAEDRGGLLLREGGQQALPAMRGRFPRTAEPCPLYGIAAADAALT
jgi:hypothetical protein